MPASLGPEADVNAVYLNEIQALPEGEQAAFIQTERDEYARDINPYDPVDWLSFGSVVDPDDLREDLIRRFDIYCRRSLPRIDRRNGVYPV